MILQHFFCIYAKTIYLYNNFFLNFADNFSVSFTISENNCKNIFNNFVREKFKLTFEG